jgi:hypothetical protein
MTRGEWMKRKRAGELDEERQEIGGKEVFGRK